MNDPEFAQFLMRIGGGVEPTKPNDMVRIPPQIALHGKENSQYKLLLIIFFHNYICIGGMQRIWSKEP